MSMYISTPDNLLSQEYPVIHKNYISGECKQYSFAVSLELHPKGPKLYDNTK